MRPLLCILLLAGCGHPRRPLPVATPSREYLDLQPGQRLRAITPILRSGGLVLDTPTLPSTSPDQPNIVLTAPDFLGYEQANYLLAAPGKVILQSAEDFINGQHTPRTTPRALLFRLPARTRHVRLLYLLRSSQQDHNMAILAAPNPARLNQLTDGARRNTCPPPHCTWVPVGVALTPEPR
jgi:hypothetical protein